MRQRRKKKSMPLVFSLLLLITGALFLFWPIVNGAINQVSMNEEIEKVQAQCSADVASGIQSENNKLAQAREYFEEYNQKVAREEIVISTDPFSFYEAVDLFGSGLLEDGLIGYIEIPKMSCNLPLYLGSSEEHMAKGATIVSGSSVPLGEVSSNCVIAAHRGFGNAPMFRDIEKLSVGDEVSVYTLWQKNDYIVTATKIIDPSDTAAVKVQQGKDLVTLITCHPYGYNTQRYVVECECSDEVTQEALAHDFSRENLPKKEITLPEIEDGLRIAGGVVLLFCVLVLLVRWHHDKAESGKGKHGRRQ